jgi:curli production assembly/transport component CsgF
MRKRRWAIAAVTSISMGTSASAFASELVYHPISPTLGGNPLNGSFLLSTAQGQGEGTKSGNQGPDLSGLDAALAAGLGNGDGSGNGTGNGNGSGNGNGTGNGSGSGSGSGSSTTNGTLQTNATFRAARTAQPLTSTSTVGGSLGNTVP